MMRHEKMHLVMLTEKQVLHFIAQIDDAELAAIGALSSEEHCDLLNKLYRAKYRFEVVQNDGY